MTGNKLNPKADPRQGEIAAKLNISTRFGGVHFNPQALRTLRGSDGVDRMVYTSVENGKISSRYLTVEGDEGPKLSERDERQLAIELARENRQRAEDGLLPVKFDDAGTASAPSSSAPPMPAPGNDFTPVGREVDLGGGGGSKSLPALVPSGEPPAKITPVPRPTIRLDSGGKVGGGSGDSKGAQINATVATGLIRDIEEARTNAARAAGKGDLAQKRYYLNQMKNLSEAAAHNPNLRGVVSVGGEKDSQGDFWPSVTFNQTPAPAQSRSSTSQTAQGSGKYAGQRIPKKNVPEFARRLGMSPREAYRYLQKEGATIY
ncbi:MAG: hypothetical protein WBP93_05150 [Pyrinomonadaceae bacterium]